ncbi:hypothetical protein LCGC14_0920620 [marine sediment metagenome]|uniref:Uncharacterized protein n=1 Tax=marine sediment metagenome TaxID=412755 RepID=A0A0F9R9P7_9ZZZZ
MMVKGYYFNESHIDFDPSSTIFKYNFKTLDISAPNGKNLHNFEKIVVYINFTEGAYSDYTQFRLLNNAITNNPEATTWTKNDTLYVDYEYNDIDYFLLMEEYTVGSEDSMFEYFNYTRNDRFMIQNPMDLTYSLNMGKRFEDFQNFTRENDPKTVLEFLDFDEDGTHELVVQKDDITGDGIFDSFKYGFVNPAGEISFHTLFQRATSVEISTEKLNDIQVSEKYQVNWKDIARPNYITVQRTITSNTTTTTRREVTNTLIQKDTDFDGFVDSEVGHEIITTSIVAEIYTEEVSHLHFTPTVNNPYGSEHDAWLTEYRNSTIYYFDTVISYTFRDFENDNAISTRYYDDIFPNHITEMYNLDNYLVPVYNNQNDEDPSNNIVVQAPALEYLLTLSHERDGVPAIYDRKIIVEDGTIEAENILATEKVFFIPGAFNKVTGIADYNLEQEIKANVIEVIPSQGAYYDNVPQFSPDTIYGYSYYYYDETGDGRHSTIFIGKTGGTEVKAIGFDYDGDSIFNPFKKNLVERHIIRNESTSTVSQSMADYIENKYGKLIDLNPIKNSGEGFFLEPTFRDSLFDLWKTQFTSETSQLIKEINALTVDKFLAAHTLDVIFGDFLDQMLAIGIGMALASVATAATANPVLGYIAYIIGFGIGYFITSLSQQTEKQRTINYYIAYQTFHNPAYEATETLSERAWGDETITNTLQGSSTGTYAPVKVETDRFAYEADVVLAPSGIDKTSGLFAKIKNIELDYALQTRGYLVYSDWGDPEVESFFYTEEEYTQWHLTKDGFAYATTVTKNTMRDPIQFDYMGNSIMYIENAIDNATTVNNDDHYDRIIPYMVDQYPTLIFADSRGSISIPEFYLDYPIMVDSDEFATLSKEYYSIYKVFNESSNTIQIIPESSSHGLYSQILSFDVYILNSIGQVLDVLEDFTDRYTYDSSTGILTLEPIIYNIFTQKLIDNPNINIIFDFKIEKYRDISDTSITLEAQNNRIATMQSIHASILEYTYQATIAQKTQERLNEIAYTIFLTTVTTALSIGVSAASKAIGSLLSGGAAVGTKIAVGMLKLVSAIVSEVYEELYVDPLIEAYVTKLVADAGGNWYEQIFWSSLAESGREAGMSMVTQSLGSIAIHSQVQTSQNLAITPQNSIIDMSQMNTELKAQSSDTLLKEIKSTLLSSLLVFAGVSVGGIFGSAGVGLANLMIPIGMIVEAGGEVKDIVENSLKARSAPVPDAIINIHSEISDAGKARIDRSAVEVSTLSEPNMPQPSRKLVTKVFETSRTDFDYNAYHDDTLRMIQKPGIHFMPDTEFDGINLGWDSEILRRIFLKNKENNELIIKISVVAINQLFRTYKSVEQNIPPSFIKEYKLNVYKTLVERIEAGKRKVISSKNIQRMIEGALIAVKRHILNEDNEFLKNLIEYKKFSLAVERIHFMNLKTNLDISTEERIIPQRVALFENLRNLLRYQDMFGSKGFTIPLIKFGKLIKRPRLQPFSLKDSRIESPELMDINYKILDITLKDLKSVGLDYSYAQLRTFKRKASEIIKEFMFSNPYSTPYINKEDIEISEKEGIDYIGHKFDLVRSVGYLLYKSQYSGKFLASKTPFFKFQDLYNYYIMKPMALTEKKISNLLELFTNRKNFNQRDLYVKQTIKDLNKYKDTFALISSSVVGFYTHALEELAALTSLILDKKITIEHESTVEDGKHVADLTIQVDKNFRTKYGALFKKKYQLDLSKIVTINIDFTDSYKGRGPLFIKAKFLKNYQSKTSISLIILTNHKLYDKTRAKTYIDSFSPYLNALGPSYFPQHIRLVTMEDFISFFEIKDISKGIKPLTDLGYIRLLKDRALSHDPDVSNEAFEILFHLYIKAKFTLKLIKDTPADAASILRTRQLDITKFLGDPNSKIDDFL